MNVKPDFIKGEIHRKIYDGITNDLLTGGLGKTGLAGLPPIPKRSETSETQKLTSEELRTLAIYNSYKGMTDSRTGGGFGVFYGPNVGADGVPSENEGKVSGKEYLAYAGTCKEISHAPVTMIVQIPDTFDPNNPCIIAAPSSGSRGIYGAIAAAGEWGLKRGFAVAYTDKGTGTGMHDLDSDTVNLINGEREEASKAGEKSNFTAKTDKEFIRNNPHRIAFKHAYSQQNPQAYWGEYVLQAIKFAFYILNLEENFGKRGKDGTIIKTVTPQNTIVIASGISNGGDSAVRAAEQDKEGIINGVVASEPNVCPAENESVVIQQGNKEWKYPNHSRAMLDYMTLLNIYQPCASLDPQIKDIAPMNSVDEILGINRCNALAEKGLLKGDTIEERSAEAQRIINDYGILTEQNLLQPSHHFIQVIEGISVTYTNSVGRFAVHDNLCGFSFAAIDPETKMPAPFPKERMDAIFGESNGIPPTPPFGGVEIINDRSKNGPVLNRESLSDSGIQDQNLDGALCLRSLITGKDESGNPVTGKILEQHKRVKQGIAQVRASGDLKGLPAIIIHGRNDAILPPNHTSRAYVALNSLQEGEKSRLRYYEITNAHHLDMLNAFPGFDSRYIPLLYYFIQALDIMYDHLRNKRHLPPNQLVRTIPRGRLEDDKVPDITSENLPSIADNPKSEDKIIVKNGKIQIP